MEKTQAKAVLDEISSEVERIAKKHNLSVSTINGQLENTCLKVSFTVSSVQGSQFPEYVRNLERNGHLYGLTVNDIGRRIDFGTNVGLTFQGLRGKKAVCSSGSKLLYLDAFVMKGLFAISDRDNLSTHAH